MKVKGIESAPNRVLDFWLLRTGSVAGKAIAHARETRSRQRRIRGVLIIGLLAALALAPMALADVDDQKDQNTKEQAHRNARKALRKGAFEQAANFYNDLITRDAQEDRKSTRLNSSHSSISYA